MTDLLRARLKELAERATPGERTWSDSTLDVVCKSLGISLRKAILAPAYEYDTGLDIIVSEDDMNFIAACSPDVILSLLSDLASLQAQLTKAIGNQACPLVYEGKCHRHRSMAAECNYQWCPCRAASEKAQEPT